MFILLRILKWLLILCWRIRNWMCMFGQLNENESVICDLLPLKFNLNVKMLLTFKTSIIQQNNRSLTKLTRKTVLHKVWAFQFQTSNAHLKVSCNVYFWGHNRTWIVAIWISNYNTLYYYGNSIIIISWCHNCYVIR